MILLCTTFEFPVLNLKAKRIKYLLTNITFGKSDYRPSILALNFARDIYYAKYYGRRGGGNDRWGKKLKMKG